MSVSPAMASHARRLITSGSAFEQQYAHSRAVVQGDWLFLAGTTGFDYATMAIAEDIETQVEQCLRNIDSRQPRWLDRQ